MKLPTLDPALQITGIELVRSFAAALGTGSSIRHVVRPSTSSGRTKFKAPLAKYVYRWRAVRYWGINRNQGEDHG